MVSPKIGGGNASSDGNVTINNNYNSNVIAIINGEKAAA